MDFYARTRHVFIYMQMQKWQSRHLAHFRARNEKGRRERKGHGERKDYLIRSRDKNETDETEVNGNGNQ